MLRFSSIKYTRMVYQTFVYQSRLFSSKSPNKSIYKSSYRLSPTKIALLDGTHSLEAHSVHCCGNGCPNCAWILYLDSLENHLNKTNNPKAELKNKINNAEEWVQNFVQDEMRFRKVI